MTRNRGDLYCNRCKKNTHCDATCYVRLGSSTPRFQNQYHNHPSRRTNNNFTVRPVEPDYNTRPSPTPSNAGNLADLTQMFVTHLNENRAQTNLSEHRKDLLANISVFDGKHRKACLMWINQLEHTVTQARIPLKQLIAAKAGPIVTTAVQSLLVTEPDASDSKVTQMILESFSNVGTKTEAFHHLRLDDNESLLAHNAEYAAIHEAAHGLPPERQSNMQTFLEYAKTLTELTSELLARKIVRKDTKIFTLRQAMVEAERIHKQARQEEITKLKRSAMRETIISGESINELPLSEEVNFMPPGRSDNHFNSTMKNNGGHWNSYSKGRNNSFYNNGGSRNSSYSDRNSRNKSYSDGKNWSSRHNYSSNYDSRRKLRRYSHQPRDPKNKVQFEYNINGRNMMQNIRRTVDNLKDKPQAYRNRFKEVVPRISKRNQEEIREDAIAEIKIQEIQEILREDLDLIFNALVIQDYIDEVDA